jgi:pimeloyl-ACP methyl ester carboxylesterase
LATFRCYSRIAAAPASRPCMDESSRRPERRHRRIERAHAASRQDADRVGGHAFDVRRQRPHRSAGLSDPPPPPPMTCDQLRHLKIPALMTYGADTWPYYRISAEAAAACIPGAQLVAVPGRHLAIVQQPDGFNAVLLQFLAKAGSQPKP